MASVCRTISVLIIGFVRTWFAWTVNNNEGLQHCRGQTGCCSTVTACSTDPLYTHTYRNNINSDREKDPRVSNSKVWWMFSRIRILFSDHWIIWWFSLLLVSLLFFKTTQVPLDIEWEAIPWDLSWLFKVCKLALRQLSVSHTNIKSGEIASFVGIFWQLNVKFSSIICSKWTLLFRIYFVNCWLISFPVLAATVPTQVTRSQVVPGTKVTMWHHPLLLGPGHVGHRAHSDGHVGHQGCYGHVLVLSLGKTRTSWSQGSIKY